MSSDTFRGPTEQELRDDAVHRVLEALQQQVSNSHLTQRSIERLYGYTRGYLSQVLNGHVTLTVRHVFGILIALKISPATFFDQVFSESKASTGQLSEIRERMARYDAALQELEAKGVLSRDDES